MDPGASEMAVAGQVKRLVSTQQASAVQIAEADADNFMTWTLPGKSRESV